MTKPDSRLAIEDKLFSHRKDMVQVREIPVLPAMPSAPAAAKRASRLTGRPFQREGRLAHRAAQVKIKGRNTPQTYKQTERCA